MKNMIICFCIFLMACNASETDNTDTAQSAEQDTIKTVLFEVEQLAGDFQFVEGPVWSGKGYLLFSDIPANKIYRWDNDSGVGIYLDSCGHVGRGDKEVSNGTGTNGLAFDGEGNLIICQHANRQLLKMDTAGTYTILADRYKGRRLNSPNDLVIKSNGAIYFTDPPYGLDKLDESPQKELPFNGVYLLQNDTLTLLDSTLTRPNGIGLSPDEKYLYVANSDRKNKIWVRYEVNENGRVSNRTVFCDANASDEKGGPDGLKVDGRGKIFATGPGGIWIISPEGKHLETIQLPEIPANCAWGDSGYKTLFATARTGLYKIVLEN